MYPLFRIKKLSSGKRKQPLQWGGCALRVDDPEEHDADVVVSLVQAGTNKIRDGRESNVTSHVAEAFEGGFDEPVATVAAQSKQLTVPQCFKLEGTAFRHVRYGRTERPVPKRARWLGAGDHLPGNITPVQPIGCPSRKARQSVSARRLQQTELAGNQERTQTPQLTLVVRVVVARESSVADGPSARQRAVQTAVAGLGEVNMRARNHHAARHGSHVHRQPIARLRTWTVGRLDPSRHLIKNLRQSSRVPVLEKPVAHSQRDIACERRDGRRLDEPPPALVELPTVPINHDGEKRLLVARLAQSDVVFVWPPALQRSRHKGVFNAHDSLLL